MESLILELKKHIIEELNLQDVTPEDILNDAPLLGDGLGLDSIDALELVVLLEKYYNVKIPDETVGREVLASINSMVAYIKENQKESE